MTKKILFLFIGLVLTMPMNVFSQSRMYGDVNGDGEVNISDVNAVIGVILGEYHAVGIVGSWISEYALDENGERFDIPAPIVVSFDFYEDQTGLWGCYSDYDNHIIDYVGFKWELSANRLSLWFEDGEHEELYYGMNADGYLLLSLNPNLSQYTAYRPVPHDHPLGTNKVSTDSPRSSRAAVTVKSIMPRE